MVSKPAASKSKSDGPGGGRGGSRGGRGGGSTRRREPSPPPPPPSRAPAAAAPSDGLDKREQQLLLDLFSRAFGSVLASDGLPAILQEIKQALYRRDFAAAFGRDDYLEAYAARWSPTRALCYAAVFLGIHHHLRDISAPADAGPGPGPAPAPALECRLGMLSVGGCAAEHVAFASYLRRTATRGALALVDSAPWSRVASLLQEQLRAPPPLSKYASAAARAAHAPLLADAQLDLAVTQADALSLSAAALAALVGPRPLLVTLMFTLNELYTAAGVGSTTAFLARLGHVLPAGSLLLVVDSPGSYAEAAVGRDKKKYPMRWLLHHTLVGTHAQAYAWEGLESHESLWFRLPEGLDYPIQLENMRYQMHLYRIRKPAP